MSDFQKEISETQLQEILKAMSEMSRRKSLKKKLPEKSADTTPLDRPRKSADS
jgi:hypothetical protein